MDVEARRRGLPGDDRGPSPLLVQGAFVLMLAVDLVSTSVLGSGSLLDVHVGLAFLIAVSVLVACWLVPWRQLPHAAVAVLPLLDLVALGLTRIGLPGTGSDILCVLPALWLGREFHYRGALVAGVGVVAGMSVPWMVLLGPVEGNVASALLAPALAALAALLLAAGTHHVRRRDEEVEQHRRFNAAILDTVDVGLVLLDRDGAYQSMNRRHDDFMRLAFPEGHSGYAGQLGQVYGEDGRHLLAREEMPSYRAMQGEEFDDCRIWVGGDPLTSRALSVSARTVHDETGAFAGAALAYKDVTDFMRALEVKDEFVASVSHELRTPLTSIRGYADLLMDRDDLPDDATRALTVVLRNSERLGRLVADLLQSAQFELGSVHVVRTRGDLAALVRDAVSAAGPAAASSQLELSYVGPERLVMMMDQVRMRQVVDNLVSNAVKYTPPHGRVEVGLSVDGARIELSVSDTGIGIDPADRDRLFTRFFRTRHAEEQNVQGVGLGLSITKSIVESHGGRIEVDSEVGRGSTFRVRMPFTGSMAAEA
ncbi:sensor histidine kinase [Nocardioides coralli]|uniref:sensor histidine kinase n=1 Tax=Nocardioides coralli TaxID=2872154 RepID=UPI001CA3897B|nr:HAMP domain-containing sensor histidine kinase [Nocardioides coralli]QZY30286.1 HAMP domain-containing histidine kinase [Nocardioides coralli]